VLYVLDSNEPDPVLYIWQVQQTQSQQAAQQSQPLEEATARVPLIFSSDMYLEFVFDSLLCKHDDHG
jgi:hypothetical protein